MKRLIRTPRTALVPLALAGCLLAGCASAGSAVRESEDAPQVELAQAFTGTETLFMRGPVPLTFNLTIHNPLDVPVTLRRVELRTQGTGAYELRAEAPNLDRTIAPAATETIQLYTWGRTGGGIVSRSSPVSLVGTATFDSPEGSLVRVFTEYLPQPG